MAFAIRFPSNQKATCLIFANLLYYLNQFGWHCYEQHTLFLPPSHRSRGRNQTGTGTPHENHSRLSILFAAIALPFAELTADLNKILIVKDEVTKELTKELAPIKADIASIKADIGTLKEDVARLDGRLTGVEKQVSHATNVTTLDIGIPAWRGKRDSDQERRIEALNEK